MVAGDRAKARITLFARLMADASVAYPDETSPAVVMNRIHHHE
jgi:hypothetical protein